MRRRDFLAFAAALPIAAPAAVFAQPAPKFPRIALFWQPSILPEWVQAYRDTLADYGYVDGKTISTETFAAQTIEDYPMLAAKVVASKPDVVMNHQGSGALAVTRIAPTLPIVVVAVDPVAQGLANSLVHPGRNVTGIDLYSGDLVGKQLTILRDILPALKRLAALNEPANSLNPPAIERLRAAAEAFEIEVRVVDFVAGRDFIAQFDQVVASQSEAIYVPASTYFPANRDLLADLQIKHRLPLIWPSSATAPRSLIGYGVSTVSEIRKAGAYVDAILKGRSPADLPIQQPTYFELAINLTTARALGITIPPTILAQATIVYE